MSEYTVTREDGETHGRYVAVVEGREAELTYTKAGTAGLIADHTGVPTELEGRGIGSALVEALIKDAREGGYKIIPLCPFVSAKFRRHPEWADLRG